MEHAGHARHRTGASVSGWMSGPSSKLRNMPTGYRLAAVIYYLDGGADAQQVFCAERRKAAPWGLQVNPESGQLFARLAQLVGPNLTQMTDDQRKEWTTTARRRQVLEYQVDRRPRRKPLAQDSVTATERFIHELIPVEDSDDGVIQPTEHVDNDSIENLILETIHPSLPAQTGHQRRESTGSTDSTTPCPIQCFGCRGISGGDDGPDQVQCSACGFWSHFGCQPENGDVDWHDPKTEYICQRCRPRPMPELFFRAEIVMLPDPRSKEDWRNDAVLWYPAEFRKHHPHTTLPKNEFEFRFLECIQWPMSDDDHMRPLRSYKLDRATCEEILKVELRLEQMGLVRAAGIHRSQQPEDHPLIPIFDAVLAPLAQLLVEFPDGHPVVDSYKLFFTADAKEKQNLKRWFFPAFTARRTPTGLVELMAPTLEKLEEFTVVAVAGRRERRRRALTVGRAMLQLLAIQYELGEPLDLNGDTFQDLVDGNISVIRPEHLNALYAILVASKPKVLSHKKHWNMDDFSMCASNIIDSHLIYDFAFQSRAYRRIHTGEIRHSSIAADLLNAAKTRPRPDSDDEDTPPAKRQETPQKVEETSRSLRPRGRKAPEGKPNVPLDKVVARGKGIYFLHGEVEYQPQYCEGLRLQGQFPRLQNAPPKWAAAGARRREAQCFFVREFRDVDDIDLRRLARAMLHCPRVPGANPRQRRRQEQGQRGRYAVLRQRVDSLGDRVVVRLEGILLSDRILEEEARRSTGAVGADRHLQRRSLGGRGTSLVSGRNDHEERG
ncbi:hypothetical protein C8R46DRAFT_1294479 [Mycena filopes]|nr:hypothetical protein C8R46DRAFT_1294479 [Mycena filopes]